MTRHVPGSRSFRLSSRLALTLAVLALFFFGCPSNSNDVSQALSLTITPVQLSRRAPTILSPSSSPYYSTSNLQIQGNCNAGSKVYIGESGITLGVPCSGTSFSATINKSVDGTYPLIIYQVDSSGYPSSSATIQWIRSSVVPSAPVLTTPLSNPAYSSGSIVLSGTCTDGLIVKVTGSNTQSTTCSNSNFSFVISKSVDGTYNFDLTQVSLSGLSSNSVSQQWIRDSALPSIDLTGQPPSINLAASANFTFSASDSFDAVSFKCSLDSNPFVSCTSPMIYSNIYNGDHTFQFQGTDQALNTTTSSPYYWTQANYNTIALYHFDDSPGFTADSSNMPGNVNNALTQTGTTAGSSARFGQSRLFTGGTSSMSTLDNPSQTPLGTQMTLEAFVLLSSAPSVSGVFPIVSKTGLTSGQYGWEFGVTGNGVNQSLYFSGSLDGTTLPVTVLSNGASLYTSGTSAFHHLAVTWSAGIVTFFIDGVQSGTGSIGGTSATLNSPNVPLQLGTDGLHFLDATLDEVRISRIVRWNNNFTPPVIAYTPD